MVHSPKVPSNKALHWPAERLSQPLQWEATAAPGAPLPVS